MHYIVWLKNGYDFFDPFFTRVHLYGGYHLTPDLEILIGDLPCSHSNDAIYWSLNWPQNGL